jgi:hypothetical protein
MLVLTSNQPERIVNIKFVALATTFVLIADCALNGPSNHAESPNDSARAPSNAARGSSSAGAEQAEAGRPIGRSRAEVHAEAVEAVKHYKATQSEERDFFNPYAQ